MGGWTLGPWYLRCRVGLAPALNSGSRAPSMPRLVPVSTPTAALQRQSLGLLQPGRPEIIGVLVCTQWGFSVAPALGEMFWDWCWTRVNF